MNIILGLIGAVIALGGAFIYQLIRSKGSEALLQNNATKEQLNTINKEVSKNDGLLEAEKEKREQIAQDLKEKESYSQSKDTILDWLNSKNK